jgi:peptidoglycan-N-acetylglucosamine deacetylase
METTSAGSDDSLGVPRVGWSSGNSRSPLRPLLVAIVACHPACLLLVIGGLWPWALALLGLSHATLLAGIFVPSSNLFGRTYTRIPSPAGERPRVWLTIDDGPDPRTTPEILDVLARFKASATFFVIGDKAKRHPELLERIISEGHQLANHSTSHPASTFWCLPPGRVQREVGETNRTIQALTGNAPAWFRPPVGHQNPFLHPIAARHGLRIVTWSAAGWDGVSISFDSALERISRQLSSGSILVIHEGYDPEPRGYTPAALLDRLLERVEENGYETFVPTPPVD